MTSQSQAEISWSSTSIKLFLITYWLLGLLLRIENCQRLDKDESTTNPGVIIIFYQGTKCIAKIH